MKCSKCGKESSGLMPFVNMDSGESELVCDYCMAVMYSDCDDLDELDQQIVEYQDIYKKIEHISKTVKIDDSELDPESAVFAYTPQRGLHSCQLMITELMKTREKLLKDMPESKRLKYELKQAVNDQNFERAESIKKKLADL